MDKTTPAAQPPFAPAEAPEDLETELADLLERLLPLVTAEPDGQFSLLIPPEALRRHPDLPGMLRCLASLEAWAEPPSAALPKALTAEPAPRPASSGNSSFRAPRQIGPYLLEEELGRGGMGVVYRARHQSLQATFAVKMIRSSEWASPEEIHRFYREARAAARLQHPHIVKVFDVGEHAGLHYLVMEHVTGGTLAEVMQRGPTEIEDRVRLLLQVTLAVEYLHSQGVIHRDLKPANILLDESGVPHVTDFGLAKVFEPDAAHTATGMVVGTPAYMAPEQAWGKPGDISVQSDIYSLGALLYELLTGRPPFAEASPLDQFLRLRDAEPLPPRQLRPEIPRELNQICLRCLEKSPAQRYHSATALAADLQRFLHREPVELPAVDIGQRITRWLRREPALASRLIGFSVMALIVTYAEILASTQRAPFVPVMSILALWSAGSYGLQKLLNRDATSRWIRPGWVLLDATLFTAALSFAEGPIESLLVGYSLLIVASAWWYRPGLVWMMTGVCCLTYLVLHGVRGAASMPGHYPLIVMGELAVVGGIVASLVAQIRELLRQRTAG